MQARPISRYARNDFITSLTLCESIETSGTAFNNTQGCIEIYGNQSVDYNTFGYAEARADNTPGDYFDLMDPSTTSAEPERAGAGGDLRMGPRELEPPGAGTGHDPALWPVRVLQDRLDRFAALSPHGLSSCLTCANFFSLVDYAGRFVVSSARV